MNHMSNSFRDKYSSVEELYKDQSNVPIMGPRKRTTTTVIKGLAIALLFVSLIGWLLFFIVSNLEATPQGSLLLSVSAPESVSPGVPFAYTITLTNEDTRAVENARIRVNYPEGFALRFSEPEALTTAGNTWEIGRIASGEKAEIVATGVLLGETGTLRTMFASASYELEGFKSTLELTDSVVTRLSEQVASLSVDSPDVMIGERVAYFTALVENSSNEPLEGLRLRLVLPEGVVLQDSSPPHVTDNDEVFWNVENIPARGLTEYSATVSWTDAVSGDTNVKLSLVGLSQSGIDFVLDEQDLTLQLGEAPILVSMTQVGEPSENGTVLTRITITNHLSSEISLSALSVALDGEVDWDRLLSVNDVVRSGNVVAWQERSLMAFGIIQSQDVVSLPFTIPLKETLGSVSVTPQIKVVVSGEDKEVTSIGVATAVPLSTE